MAKSTNNTEISKAGVKLIEYPVIYSYIYERESQDIRRLHNDFKNLGVKKKNVSPGPKTIVRFKFENGKTSAVFKEQVIPASEKKVVTKTRVSSTTRTTRVSKPVVNKTIKSTTSRKK